jgi:hypothetical protein
MIKVKKSEVASRLTGRFKAGCNGQTSKSRMLLQVRSMTEGARNAVLINIVVVSLALLLSCCTNERETKALLGLGTVGQTPDTVAERSDFACQQYGFYPGSKQFDDCMKYIGSKRSILPSSSPR